MHAETDDDPRFRQREKESPWRMFAISLASAAFIWAGVETFAKPAATNVNRVNAAHQSAIQQETSITKGSVNRRTVENVAPQKATYTAPTVANSYAIERAPSATTPSPKPAKQTSFNDQNYSGGREINTISFNEPMDFEEPEVKKPGKVRVTVVSEEPRLEDLCWLKEGSIERRSCRQALDLGSRNQ